MSNDKSPPIHSSVSYTLAHSDTRFIYCSMYRLCSVFVEIFLSVSITKGGGGTIIWVNSQHLSFCQQQLPLLIVFFVCPSVSLLCLFFSLVNCLLRSEPPSSALFITEKNPRERERVRAKKESGPRYAEADEELWASEFREEDEEERKRLKSSIYKRSMPSLAWRAGSSEYI